MRAVIAVPPGAVGYLDVAVAQAVVPAVALAVEPRAAWGVRPAAGLPVAADGRLALVVALRAVRHPEALDAVDPAVMTLEVLLRVPEVARRPVAEARTRGVVGRPMTGVLARVTTVAAARSRIAAPRVVDPMPAPIVAIRAVMTPAVAAARPAIAVLAQDDRLVMEGDRSARPRQTGLQRRAPTSPACRMAWTPRCWIARSVPSCVH